MIKIANDFNESVVEMLEEMNNSAIFETLAKTYRSMYDALIAVGFTKDEVMAILTSKGLGIKTS